MCGIVGYVPTDAGPPVSEVILNGLDRLEYRGYDSAGLAVANESIDVEKTDGEVASLDGLDAAGTAGIGHTRWSTHGPPTEANAHPHTDCGDAVVVAHNGIIENYRSLREELEAAGHTFDSDTDTEVIPHLIEAERASGADSEEAFRNAIDRLEGSFAVAAIVGGATDRVFGAREESPLVVGVGEDGHYLGSDAPAFIDHTDQVIYLEDGETVVLSSESVQIRDHAGETRTPSVKTIEWDPEDAGKSGYEHYMHKEIHEQPRAIRDCLRNRVNQLDGTILLPQIEDISVANGVQLVGAGTSYHAAQYGAMRFGAAGIRAQAIQACEYDANRVPVSAEVPVFAITQSGETADTLAALSVANQAGAPTCAVTNVVESSAVRRADEVVYIRSGPEIGVAATKTFLSQAVTLLLIAGVLTEAATPPIVERVRAIPDQLQHVLDQSSIRGVARSYSDAEAFFFIGRGFGLPVAREGALKLKEITYIHAEGFATGELKHGPLALVTEYTPVIALIAGDPSLERTLGNVKEVKARGAPVIAVTDRPDEVGPYVDAVVSIPAAGEVVTPLLGNVQLQLFAYWVARELGRSIDKPRNLAKSVTVR